MPIDPGTAILVGQGIRSLGALASGDKNKKDREEQARQFDESHRWAEEYGRTQNTFDQTDALGGLTRSLENAPLRDKVLYMLTQRAGMTPGEFKPRDMANPWTAGSQAPSQGGIDLGAQAASAGNYKMGAGGVDPRIYQTLMAKLGMTMGPDGPSLGDPVIRPGSVHPNQGPGPTVGPGGITDPGSPTGEGQAAEAEAAKTQALRRRFGSYENTPVWRRPIWGGSE